MTRQPTHRFDFGDDATIGAQLKRVGVEFKDFDIHADFGVFMGKRGENYVVGIKSWDASKIVRMEVYPSVEHMQEVWQLD